MLREEELQDMAEEMKVFNPSVLSQRTVGKRRENRKLGNESTRSYFPSKPHCVEGGRMGL